MVDPERDTGFLSKRERRYLENKDLESGQDERDVRRGIRNHLRNAILDFSVLYGEEGHRSEKRDRAQVFGGERPVTEGVVGPGGSGWYGPTDDMFVKTEEEIEEGLLDAVAFLYSVAKDAGLDGQDLIKKGIQRAADAESKEYEIYNVLVTLDTKESIARRAFKKFQKGQDLTDEEVRILLETRYGQIEPRALAEYLRERT